MNNSSALRRSPFGVFPGQQAPRLYDRVGEVLRTRHYSRRCFLTHLAVSENLAASTQNQALAAVLLLYEHVLEQPRQDHLRRAREQHEGDLKRELGGDPLPDALVRKYPNADREWGCQLNMS